MTATPSYCTYTDVYEITGLTNTEIASATVTDLILYAEAELESMTGRKFTSANAITEIINAPKKDVTGISGTYGITINLRQYPIQSITSFTQLDINGNATATYANLTSVQIAAGTISTNDYWLNSMVDPITNLDIPYGKITLKTDVFSTGIQKVKVSYTYGYSTVPVMIKELAVRMAALRTWVAFLGGNYNFINSYSIPQQSVNKGDLYYRGLSMTKQLQEGAERLLTRIGERKKVLMVASSLDR